MNNKFFGDSIPKEDFLQCVLVAQDRPHIPVTIKGRLLIKVREMMSLLGSDTVIELDDYVDR